MKKTRLALMFALMLLCTVLAFSLTSCTDDENIYTKDDVNSLIAELETALTEKATENEAAITALKAEYTAKVAELEKANSDNESAITTLNASYTAKVAELEAVDKANADALAELKADYEADLAELQKADEDNEAAIESLTSTYESKVAELEASDKANADALAELTVEYNDAVEKLEADIAANSEAITACESELQDKIDALCEKYDAKVASIEKMIATLNEADAANGDKIAELEEKVNSLLKSSKMFTVTFDSVGSTVASQTVEWGEKVIRPENPNRDGYIFDGWFTGYYDEEKWVFSGYSVTDDITLTAKWTPIVYEIKYNLNGGVNDESNLANYTIETSTVTLSAPSRDYYDFGGWYDNADFEGEAITQIVLGSTGNIELYAKWTLTVYEIKYHLDSGTNNGSNPKTYTSESNTIALGDPARAGYEFIGWFTDEECTEGITEISHGSHGEMQIYAKWEAIFKVEDNLITGLTDYAKANITELEIPSEIDGVKMTKIASDAFSGCTGLTNVTIPDGVTGIGFYAFSGCTGLTSVTIPDGVTGIPSYVFSGCTGLTNVTIPDSVTIIASDAFDGCTSLVFYTYDNGYYLGNADNPYLVLFKAIDKSLTSCDIHEDTRIVYSKAFSDCTSLSSVTIGDSVTSIGTEAFKECSNLEAIYITDIASWCYIDFAGQYTNPLTNGGNLYLNGEPVTDLVIPDGVTRIGSHAFNGYTGLTNVTIPDSVTSIGSYAFSGCTGLTNVTIPDSVTSIGPYAFLRCTGLTNVTIPDSVTSIGFGAFSGCTSLTSVYYKGTATEWSSINFDTGLTNSTVYYYSATEPTLNVDGTAYDGNYWHYDENGEIAIW